MDLRSPAAWATALTTRLALRRSMPGRVSLRLTGIPPAMLAARRSIRRSPPLAGSSPACRAVTAASQSVLASRVAPSLMLVPAVMNLLVKSSRCSQLPQSMSRPAPASRGWMPRAQARSASPSWRGFTVVTGFLPGRGGDGTAGDVGERGHAEVDGLFLALQGRVDLGELVLGAGEADLESLDLAEPAFALGLGDAVAAGCRGSPRAGRAGQGPASGASIVTQA